MKGKMEAEAVKGTLLRTSHWKYLGTGRFLPYLFDLGSFEFPLVYDDKKTINN
jgi:hypothetical protein